MKKSTILKTIAALYLSTTIIASSVQMIPAADLIFETAAEIPGTTAESTEIFEERSETTAEISESGQLGVYDPTGEPAPDIFEETEDDVIVADHDPSDILEENSEEWGVSVSSADTDELTGAGASGKQLEVSDPTIETSERASDYTGRSRSQTQAKSSVVPRSPFSDVKSMNEPYYVGICWAGNSGVSGGFADGTFRSAKTCSRGEAMMFIWKMMGKPAPKYVSRSPFRDVSKNHMYYRAVLWGWQKGVTKGYSDGTFGVNKSCTRGQVMRFLWNLKGRPAVTGRSPFADITSAHPYYKAVVWGARTGITTGYSDGTFGTDKLCTRGQIVTFLYRYFLNSFYTVKTSNGKIMSVSSPIVQWNSRYYEKVLTADKTCITFPTIPKKTLFIGNSLLVGLGSSENGGRFGMCASDSRHDYAYKVQRAILAKNVQAKFSRMPGTAFEGSVNRASAMQWYDRHKENFAGDLDLIVIQLGDNVNTGAKEAAFKKNIGEFLARLKADCPRARIIYAATWYRRPAIVSSVINACKDNGCDFVSIADLYGSANLPSDGYVITYNNGSTAVAVGGSLSHPNNRGMEQIAERIIDMLKL